MNLSLAIPIKAQIINSGFVVALAQPSWSKKQLGVYANRSGVYVLHSNGLILYVGKTTAGDYATFGERLRRHFQQKASGNSTLYQLLSKQTQPIRAYLLDLEDVSMMIDAGSMTLSAERKALVMEQVLIGIYEPIGNRDKDSQKLTSEA
jgi:hypothetical protein